MAYHPSGVMAAWWSIAHLHYPLFSLLQQKLGYLGFILGTGMKSALPVSQEAGTCHLSPL